MSRTVANSTAPFEINSTDPEVMALQAMIRGLHHFNARSLTPRHFKVLMAVELCIKVTKTHPRLRDIATFSRLKPDEIKQEVAEMVALRYLHEETPTFGDGTCVYRIGSMGGTLLRQIMRKKPDLKAVG